MARHLFSCRRFPIPLRAVISGGACGIAIGVALQDFAVGFAVAIGLVLAFRGRARSVRCPLSRQRS